MEQLPSRPDAKEHAFYPNGLRGTLVARTSTFKFTWEEYWPLVRCFLPIGPHSRWTSPRLQTGVPDIEVEIRRINRQLFALDTKLEEVIEKRGWKKPLPGALRKVFSYRNLLPILSGVGFQISPDGEKPEYAGTMGLHIRLSGHPSQTCVLTCRHVAHRPIDKLPFKKGQWIMKSQGYTYDQEKGPTHRTMNRLCLNELNQMIYKMRSRLAEAEQELRDLIQLKEMEDPNKKLRDDDEENYAGLSHNLPFERSVFEGIEKWKDESRRGFLRDLALISLDRERFNDQRANTIFIDEPEKVRAATDQCDDDLKGTALHDVFHGGFLAFANTVSLDEAHGRSFLVGKRGATTGLTFGITNEIKAIVRTAEGKEPTAWGYIVVPSKSGHFSKRGDSGAAVFDANSKVLGLVNGGYEYRAMDEAVRFGRKLKPEDEKPLVYYQSGNDLTFVSPIQAIFEDIQEHSGCVPGLL
ncbi:hypothetical protein ACJZ2D_001556 [Fusarium nematophilum]